MTKEEFIAKGYDPRDWIESWVGVDFDATLAEYLPGRQSLRDIGAPIPSIMKLVKNLLESGEVVKIFTARVCDERVADEQRNLITLWLMSNDLPKLEITCKKDYGMTALYDDRAWHVEPNTGVIYDVRP